MRIAFLSILSLLLLLNACKESTPSKDMNKLAEGTWRGLLNIGNEQDILEVPFNFEVAQDNKITILNGNERIEVSEVHYEENFLRIKMPVFGSEFKLSLEEESLSGYWHNYHKDDYKLAFRASQNTTKRFDLHQAPSSLSPLNKRWKVTFSPDSEHAYPAIGLFESNEKGITTGTFLTETGDYRYLEGVFDGQELKLSCFDGSHVFLFKAQLDSMGHLNGTFWSGKHWNEPWVAVPNDSFELRSMEALTYLKEGYDEVEFSFPDIDSQLVTLKDDRFAQKVTIVQITGSWCPNCMDETNFLVDIYQKYHSKGLEIVAVDYELKDNFEVFRESHSRLKKQLGVSYPMLYGGIANKAEASKTWPMLNQIISYPTTLFLDKKGTLRQIHTGFSGPGTGAIYNQYVQKTTAFIEQLLAE
jgi:thiol-disulfide isomerase/thioredoxin